jgi:hypothetical protein
MKRITWIYVGNLIGGFMAGGIVFAVPYVFKNKPFSDVFDSFHNPFLALFALSLPFFLINFLIPQFRERLEKARFSSFIFPLVFFSTGALLADFGFLILLLMAFYSLPSAHPNFF